VRADRLLSIMLLLDTHRHLTAGDLARRLEVSERTIYRDIDALSAAGVPVYAQRGGRGGCYLPDGYRTRLTGLTSAEAQVLSLPGPAQVLADLGLREAVDAAQIKLLRAVPDGIRPGARAAHERVLVEAAGWDPPLESTPHLGTVQSAVWSERKLDVVYCRGDGATVERRVDPLGLVAKGSVWYLVAGVAGELRVYRVARLIDARILDDSIVRPPGFDLAAYWRHSSAAFQASIPRVTVLVRVAPAGLLAVRAARRVGIDHEAAPASDGWIELSLRFDGAEDARTFVLGCGPLVEVLAPPAMRQEVARLTTETAELYRRSRDDDGR
jgi:predicted DNA-binding transcriptional regulator YafY